jgi:hypothetical protein
MPTEASRLLEQKENKAVLYCNVTLRRVPVTVVAVKKLRITYCIFCVCILIYPACKAHALYDIVNYVLSASVVFLYFIS